MAADGDGDKSHPRRSRQRWFLQRKIPTMIERSTRSWANLKVAQDTPWAKAELKMKEFKLVVDAMCGLSILAVPMLAYAAIHSHTPSHQLNMAFLLCLVDMFLAVSALMWLGLRYDYV